MQIPVYQQIKKEIIKDIKAKAANALLLSERDLAVKYEVSRMTVRRAINELVEEGHLYREANKGTFVADKKLFKKNTLHYVHDVNYKDFYFDVEASAEPDIQKVLKLKSDEQIVRLIRIMLSGDTPVAVEEIYASKDRLSGVDIEQMGQWQSLNKLIDQHVKNCRFYPLIVPTKYASILQVEIDTPIIMSECTVTNKQGETVIFIKTYNNPKERVLKVTS